MNARAILEYAKSIGAKKLGALYDSGYGTVVYNELRKISDAYDVTFVATEKFEISATDTTSQAAKIRAAQPEAITKETLQAGHFALIAWDILPVEHQVCRLPERLQ